MSNIYIQEPPTYGKVLLKTTIGDIDVELWSKETPKACRNFVQLCLEGYYNDTIFHRVIKGFIAQGGDPEGTGLGGESIYDGPFKNEVHSRLRFCRRGLVALANSGVEDNGSQFFFTLAATPELQSKHTIFGKVAGETIYNMIKFDELDVDGNDRPTFPPKILKTEVLNNPFPDIEPRVKVKKLDDKPKKDKVKGVKNFKLLSFGSEAEEDEENLESTTFEKKKKSAHDLLEDPKMSSEPALKKVKGSKQLIENTVEAEEEAVKLASDTEEHENPPDEIDKPADESDKKAVISDLLSEISKYDQIKRTVQKRGSSRESYTLQLLNKFKSKINTANQTKSENNEVKFQNDWMTHEFKCVDKEIKLAKDANTKNSSWFDITDPRNELNVRKREDNSKQTNKKLKN